MILGLTVNAGLIIGLYTTGFAFAQTLAVVPVAWAGDRLDKRTLLLAVLGIGVVAYALFPIVDSSASFIVIRGRRGIAVTGTGLMTLSLVGQRAEVGTRANHIGKTNTTSFAASITGSLSAGTRYEVISRHIPKSELTSRAILWPNRKPLTRDRRTNIPKCGIHL